MYLLISMGRMQYLHLNYRSTLLRTDTYVGFLLKLKMPFNW